ncbi:MAG TPA: hypothetical protein VL403_17515 [Candidatus Kryptonia bacterium]|nr:hypothetical protein [Candidatus Kryptonia bacterium]
MSEGTIKLHLGCGKNKLSGFVGVDIAALPGVDVVHDLSKLPWPFGDDSVSEVVMLNILEHLPDTVATLTEVWRITQANAAVRILVPYYNSRAAWDDPTHCRFFTERTWDYFTDDPSKQWSRFNFYTHARFDLISLELLQPRPLRLLPRSLQLFLAHRLATVAAMDVRLRTRKS